MKDSVGNILEKLNCGEINYKKAVKLIKKINTKPKHFTKKASKLKIIIIDKSQNKSIKIPALHFWFLNFLINIAFSLGFIGLNFCEYLDENTKRILESADRRDIKKLFNELKKHGHFDLVNINAGNQTMVKISIL